MAGEVKANWVTDDVYAAADANDVANAINRSLGAAQAHVGTVETTTSTTFADLATTTDSVTVTIGPSGLALVSLYALMYNTTAGSITLCGFAISGANTLAAADDYAINVHSHTNNSEGRIGAAFLLTALNAGSTTFKMKYRVTANTGNWANRRISVIPL